MDTFKDLILEINEKGDKDDFLSSSLLWWEYKYACWCKNIPRVKRTEFTRNIHDCLPMSAYRKYGLVGWKGFKTNSQRLEELRRIKMNSR